MSEETKGWRLIPAWLPVVVTAVTILCTAGATYATNGAKNESQDRAIAELRARVERLESIDRRLARIEGKLGIGGN